MQSHHYRREFGGSHVFSFELSDLEIEAYQERCAELARERLCALLDALPKPRDKRWSWLYRRGLAMPRSG